MTLLNLPRALRAASLCCLAVASTAVMASPAPRRVPDAVTPLPLTAVRLTGGPLLRAQRLDADYLLKLEPDRMMAYYRIQAGLKPKAAGYGGWDGGGKNLTGHIAGHYLSAVSMMYAATGDIRFKQRADYLVSELQTVQARHANGYCGALEHGEERFAEVSRGDIRSGGFDLNGLWSPWYVLHKTFAGLRDAYRYTQNRAALQVETRFAGWAEKTLAPLTEEQLQKMLNTEFGGMNEVMADLYADTGDRRWLALSDKFVHHAVVDPLARREDNLAGKHGNTQVPKLLGSLMRYIYTGDRAEGIAAEFFWESVVNHHTFATGGHGKDEYFAAPDRLSDQIDGRTAESCNVYNMLKMTRKLFALRPDARYAEFQERALYNHVLASIDPADGRTCYMVPVGRGVRREYQDMFENFTCCVGSGMENHALLGDGIYYESGDALWVNLYAPTTALWARQGARLEVQTAFPEADTVTVRIALAAPRRFTLALRRPAWAGAGFRLAVNGRPLNTPSRPGSYVRVARIWRSGDAVSLTLPRRLHLEPVADNPGRAAILLGPLALAGDLGPGVEPAEGSAPPPIPVFVTENPASAGWLTAASGSPGGFHAVGVNSSADGTTRDVLLKPFYRLHDRTYAVYWDLFTPAQWKQRAAEIAAEQERQRKLEAATVSFVQPGMMQSERDYHQQGENSYPVRVLERAGRAGRGWFAFEMPVDPSRAQALIVTYVTGERRRATFDISVDGVRLASQEGDRSAPARFIDVRYPLPAASVQGKQKITVRFDATNGNDISSVFGLRVIKE